MGYRKARGGWILGALLSDQRQLDSHMLMSRSARTPLRLTSQRRAAMFRAVATGAVLLCAVTKGASSQATLENDEMRLELIGLKQWTVPMIEDSLRRYAP